MKLTNEKIPYFNALIYLQNKTQIGKVDEIFGPINESYFSIKMMEGIVATSYAKGDKFYIDLAKLLPLARFLPQPNDRRGTARALRRTAAARDGGGEGEAGTAGGRAGGEVGTVEARRRGRAEKAGPPEGGEGRRREAGQRQNAGGDGGGGDGDQRHRARTVEAAPCEDATGEAGTPQEARDAGGDGRIAISVSEAMGKKSKQGRGFEFGLNLTSDWPFLIGSESSDIVVSFTFVFIIDSKRHTPIVILLPFKLSQDRHKLEAEVMAVEEAEVAVVVLGEAVAFVEGEDQGVAEVAL
ncbi:hypothetical protein Scep_004182 [Stephania cephalantha]|uniref:H/ACA ribonucleoprotein complex subunit n=1 Tax=Stephania cephalantha TaxID=152367 RepID=A0AAP0KTG0_9MAGN